MTLDADSTLTAELGVAGAGDRGAAEVPVPVPPEGAGLLAVDGVPLSADEAGYVRASRAENTLRGYRSDWAEFTTWCASRGLESLPADGAALSGYLSGLARAGAAVGTLNRRRAAIRYAHTMAGHPDPCRHPRVVAVWEGIRRTHTRPPDQAKPLMPPFLFQVLDACPTTRTWKDPRRSPEPDLAGARDRALLLVGFVGALRRSELAALTLADVTTHPEGLVLALSRSKTNQHGDRAELVILPRAREHAYCPVTALAHWLELAGIGPLPHGDYTAPTSDDGTNGTSTSRATAAVTPLLQGVTKANRPTRRALRPESVNTLVQHAITRTGRPADGYSAHSLRAGFVTYAHLRGASDRAIAHQTRHRSMASLGQYIRIHTAWTDNAATQLL